MGVGRSPAKRIEKTTPKGASRHKRTATVAGAIYFCPMFWNRNAPQVARRDRYASEPNSSGVKAPSATGGRVMRIASQENRAAEAN